LAIIPLPTRLKVCGKIKKNTASENALHPKITPGSLTHIKCTVSFGKPTAECPFAKPKASD